MSPHALSLKPIQLPTKLLNSPTALYSPQVPSPFKMFRTLSSIFTTLLLASSVIAAEGCLPINDPPPSIICDPVVLRPSASCFCPALFAGLMDIKCRPNYELGCIDFFGSEENIPELMDACRPFEVNGKPDPLKIAAALNAAINVCYADPQQVLVQFN